jgi:hypothetical protein
MKNITRDNKQPPCWKLNLAEGGGASQSQHLIKYISSAVSFAGNTSVTQRSVTKSEVTDLANDGEFDRAPRVCAPVHEARTQVSCDDPTQCCYHDCTQILHPKVDDNEAQVDHHQADTDPNTDTFLYTFP